MDDVDEMFLFLQERLPLPDKVRCRTGIVWLTAVRNSPLSLNLFVSVNKAYDARIQYFSHTLEWWQLSEEERKKLPAIIFGTPGIHH